MALSPEDLARVDERARQVGIAIGWALSFGEASNPGFVFVTADTFDNELEQHHIVVYGPKKVDEVTLHEIDLFLDQLETGERRIVVDEDGDPRLL